MQEAQVSGVQLLKPGEDPAIVLDLVNEAFHQMALPVQMPVIVRGCLAVRAGRNDRHHTQFQDVLAKLLGIVPFVGQYVLASITGVDALFAQYNGKVPAEADLVCYWFDKAQREIETGSVKRAGLLATQGIRGGANRRVLQRIKETGDIFMAWSDHPWVLEGAAVHISIVGFDDGSEGERALDGQSVPAINANLTVGVDLTAAKRLKENLGIAFMGDTKGGPFDIPDELAQRMLSSPNPHGKSSEEVVQPWVNGRDITGRRRGMWIIDFGDMSLEQAARYETPFEYVNSNVRPQREKSKSTIANWWLHERPRPDMRKALQGINRYVATPRVSKHRLFAWMGSETLSDSAIITFARDDDYTFGVLQSRFHELWALAMGTQLETRPATHQPHALRRFRFRDRRRISGRLSVLRQRS